MPKQDNAANTPVIVTYRDIARYFLQILLPNRELTQAHLFPGGHNPFGEKKVQEREERGSELEQVFRLLAVFSLSFNSPPIEQGLGFAPRLFPRHARHAPCRRSTRIGRVRRLRTQR